MAATLSTLDLVTAPLYTFADVDYLARVSRGTAKRWLGGYWYTDDVAGRVKQPPVTPLHPHHPDEGTQPGASFVDLVEVIAIGTLKQAGFSLRRIREIVETCQTDLGVPRPLTTLRFRTDGREIFIDRGEILLEIGRRKGNQAWTSFLEPFLQTLDYASEIDVARRWWPSGQAGPVMVDPDYGYGFPVVAHSGVRTDILLERWEAGDLEAQIADDFGLDPTVVERALQFEMRLARPAA